jgi:Family of unknown function (DUF6275)
MSDQKEEASPVRFTSYSDIPRPPAVTKPVFEDTGEVNPAPEKDEFTDFDRFIVTAKFMIIENYNRRKSSETPLLEIDDIFIVSSFSLLDNWKVTISSNVVKGLIWMVTLDKRRSMTYIEVYKKINNIRIPLERVT